MKKYQCPCCGYFTYKSSANVDWESWGYIGYICPVCFWENDPFIFSDNELSLANGVTLNEAKDNFLQFGACRRSMLPYVRPPRDDEKNI